MNKETSLVGYIQLKEESTYRIHIVKDGLRKYRAYFLQRRESIPKNHAEVLENNLPFILFSDNPASGGIRLLGMYVPAELRGTEFTDIMLSQFFHLLDTSDKSLGLTGQIKKPLLAAKLSKIGFIPERSDMIARIIGIGPNNVPNVLIESNIRGEGIKPKNISSTGLNTFYNIVNSNANGLGNEGRRVAIQTVYIPPGNRAILEYIETHREGIAGKIRIYPKRVQKLLQE